MLKFLLKKTVMRQVNDYAEIIILSGNYWMARWLNDFLSGNSPQYNLPFFLLLAGIILVWAFISKLTRISGITRSGTHVMLFFELLKANLIAFLVFSMMAASLNLKNVLSVFTIVFILNQTMIYLLRVLTVKVLNISRVSGHDLRKIILFCDDNTEDLLINLMNQKEWGYQVVYILTDSENLKKHYHTQSRIYPLRANVKSILKYDIVDEVIYCVSKYDSDYMGGLIETCSELGIRLMVHQLAGVSLPNSPSKISFIGRQAFRVYHAQSRNELAMSIKTALEIAVAALILFVLSPFMLLIAVAIKGTSNGPVIFKQQRVGLRGRKFYLFKFRTMVSNAESLKNGLAYLNESDGPAFKIKKDPRITAFGSILRKTGLDELPQLYNVLRGEMSLVGPRPMLPDEVKEQEDWHLKRHSVKPGLTCSWQVSPNRNEISFDRWMQLDLEYIENWSVKNDFVLFFKTVKSVFLAKGN